MEKLSINYEKIFSDFFIDKYDFAIIFKRKPFFDHKAGNLHFSGQVDFFQLNSVEGFGPMSIPNELGHLAMPIYFLA